MEYLLVMSLSGSTMAVIYLLMRRFFWNKICARLYYLLAKMAVLYYLIPLPFLKQWYRAAIRGVRREGETVTARISLTLKNYAVHADERLYVNIYAKIQILVVTVWVLGVCILIARHLMRYARLNRRVAGFLEKNMPDRHREIVAEYRKEFGVKRPVGLYRCTDEEPTMTFGVLRPVIVCNREPESREGRLLIRHEMVHIKRGDIFWDILLELVALLHWWNPIMWMLYRDFERVCECSCDETAMHGKSGEEVTEYLRLLVEEALGKKEKKGISIKWKAGFGEDAKKIKERMENLMKNKKWNRFAACALVAALTFANSMTVFAYRDTVHMEVTEDASQEEIDEFLDQNVATFISNETEGEDVQEFELNDQITICYDRQFTDEEGNVYPVLEDDSIEPHCNHTYVSGIYEGHIPNSDGGCTVKVYNAQRCSKCGYILLGSLKSTHIYEVCPH